MTESACWFAARTRHGQELALRRRLDDLRIECFIPSKMTVRERNGRKSKVEVPVISNLIFIRTTKKEACSLANSGDFPLYYVIDHSTRTLLVVPDKQMEDFIRVVTQVPESICPEMQDLPVGADVRITSGSLEGVEGKVILLPNRTYVVVSIGRIAFAKVQVPRANVCRI